MCVFWRFGDLVIFESSDVCWLDEFRTFLPGRLLGPGSYDSLHSPISSG